MKIYFYYAEAIIFDKIRGYIVVSEVNGTAKCEQIKTDEDFVNLMVSILETVEKRSEIKGQNWVVKNISCL